LYKNTMINILQTLVPELFSLQKRRFITNLKYKYTIKKLNR